MLALADESSRRFRQQFLGRTLLVLWERQRGGVWSGLTGNYVRVYAASDEALANRITDARLEKLWRDGVWGIIEPPPR
jgi:threonylcarbamoyladenosine tRNA methylthiotransferase MtaB